MFNNLTKLNSRQNFTATAGVIVAIALAGCTNNTSKVASTSAGATPVRIALASAIRGDGSTTLTASLSADQRSTISAEVSDRIVRWPVKLGQRLNKGDLIAELDSSTTKAQVDQAEGQVRQAKAEVERLTAEYRRAAQETAAQLDAASAGIVQAEANRVKLDSFSRGQEIRQAEAKVVQAKADLELAEKELVRFRELVASGAASRQTLDQVQARYDVTRQQVVLAEQTLSLAREGARSEDRTAAKAQVAQSRSALLAAQSRPARLAAIRFAIDSAMAQLSSAEALLSQAQIQLRKHRIVAPFSGRVLALQSELGELANPGTPLITLGSISKLKLLFSIPEQYRPQLRQTVFPFTVDSVAGKTYVATVSNPGFSGDQRTRNFAFEGKVENPNEVLLPGMVAKLQLKTGDRPVGVLVPLDSLIMDGTEASVFVSSNGKAQRRRVLVGSRSAEQAEVRDGLVTGERVIRSPKGLVDGGRIREVER